MNNNVKITGETPIMMKENPLRTGNILFNRVLTIAHRGARAFAPENTLSAFSKAIAFGCQMFEIDVHLTKDREIVIHHDDDLMRCTDVQEKFPDNRSYYISDFSYDELQILDAGTWYFKQILLPSHKRQPFLQTLTDQELEQYVSPQDRELYGSGEIKIPTLRQALELARPHEVMVNIEIKSLPRMYTGIADAVVTLVENLGLDDRVLISSFDHEQLVAVRQRTNIIATGVLTSDRIANPGHYLNLLDADAYHPGCYGEYDSIGFGSVTQDIDPCGINSTLASGRSVNVWTCNDKFQIEKLISAGVTGVITDYPNRVFDVTQ